MSAASNGRGSRWIASALVGMCLGLATACATTSAPDPLAGTATLSDVRVDQQGEMTVVTLQGVGQPLHSAREENGRLLVDLAGVRPVGVPGEIASVSGLVQEVEVSSMMDATGAPFTRVALTLDGQVRYDVLPEGNDLAIRVLAAGEGADFAQGIEGADVAEVPAAQDDSPAPAESAAPVAPPSEPAPPAHEVTDVTVEADGALVRVHADGRLDRSQSFTLENPARLVIDLEGVRSTLTQSELALAGPHVRRARVGQHPDRVRIVLDGASRDALPAHRVAAADDGLVIAFGEGAEAAASAAAGPSAALDQASAAKPVPGAENAATRVTEVALHSGAGSSRVVVATEGPASYQLYEPDPETVVLSLLDSLLAPGADARIAPEPGGPVSLVMAFQQPEVQHPEVRVVITRAAGQRPVVSREGANVVVAFEQTGAAAQIPPALAGDSSNAAAKAMGQATAAAAPSPNAQGLEVLQEGGLLDGKQYVGRRISLDFKDVDIDDVLRLIAEVSDLNIIAGEEVAGKVTIRLVDVPWDQALDVILLTRALGFVKVGNVLRIAPQSLLQQESEARLQERRAKEKLVDLIVKLPPVNYAAVNNVAQMVQRLLSSRGTVNTDTRTNTVIIKDIPSVIDESVALIKAIDTPTPQVLIEAKIVEANLDFSRELGTVWGFGVQRFEDAWVQGADSQTRGSPDARLHPDARIFDSLGDDLNNFAIENPISSISTALVNLGAFLLNEQFNLEVQLQAAESTGEGKVISSPRVVTLDNREAEIEQGVAIPYQTFENGDAQLQFVDAVLSLKVKPHITADKSIIMQLEVTRDAPDDSVATGSSGAPAIAKNQAKTETLVRDGQTLVIGGIYTIQKGTRASKVPYLADIPVVGWAFRSSEVRDIRKELLIFVTPRIVEMPQLGT